MSVTTDTNLQVDSNTIVNDFMTEFSTFLEAQIKAKAEILQLFKRIVQVNPDDVTSRQQMEQTQIELRDLIKSLLDLRKDSEFIAPETKDILSSEGFCPDCKQEHKELEFSFNETQTNEQLIAFTHSSSWIGNVRYDTDAKTMRIKMNNENYNHCGVERIDYDKFEGAPSKGEHWWREIKDRFNC